MKKSSRNCVRATLVGLVVAGVIHVGGLAGAVAGGSATDDDAPNPWLNPPTVPAMSIGCFWGRTLLTNWTKLGAGNSESCTSTGWPIGQNIGQCLVITDCESYSNAATKGNEIWAYTWSYDGLLCFGDECATVNKEGLNKEKVQYYAIPMFGCSAQIKAEAQMQFDWRYEGVGNVDVEIAGLMAIKGEDLIFPTPVISGGQTAFAGSRGDTAPSTATITITKGPFEIELPVRIHESTLLTPDEDSVGIIGNNKAPLVNLSVEIVVFDAFVKGRSYGDEETPDAADVQGWIQNSDPGFKATLICTGLPEFPHCAKTSTSTYKKP